MALGRIDAVLNDRMAGLITIEESGLDLKFGGDPVEWLSNAYPFVDNRMLFCSMSLHRRRIRSL